MRKTYLILFAFLFAACSAPAAPTATPTSSTRVEAIPTALPTSGVSVTSPTMPAPTLISVAVVAHRGGAALAPENTLAAFENALKIGVDMVECDVHLSKDGEVVVMHDPNVSTTTNGSGRISDLTLAELKKLNAAAKFRGGFAPQTIPTLAELLDLVKGKVAIQIEIKVNASNARYPGIERKVIDLVNARGMTDQVAVISFDFPTIKEIKTIDPRIKTGALVNAAWMLARAVATPERIVAEAIEPTGADYFLPAAGSVNEAIVQAAHARGVRIGVWTVDAPQDMCRYAGYGVDAITTNNQDELKRALGK